ncbi:MAG: stage II sporulation protein P [Clostridia bacterium]|nr:stage II sporulation protein P [Clostridia bacterium]
MRIRIITHWQARALLQELGKLFLTFIVVFTLVSGAWCLVKTLANFPAVTKNFLTWIPQPVFEKFLMSGLPTLSLQASAGSKADSSEALAAVQVLASPLLFLAGNSETASLLAAGESCELLQSLPPESPPPATLETTSFAINNKNPLVAIYNTHNAESYQASQGQAKFEGQNGGVEQVAAVLAESLSEDYGIPVVRSTNIHDYPDFTLAYANSEKTLKQLLAENPSVLVAIDVHRDAGLSSPPVVEIDGQQVAQVLFIVGSDARQENPHWRQNEAFARRLAAKIDELYPGLCRGVRVQEGRYNQHLLPRSLLLEVGSETNTLVEAERSARLIAKALAIIIEDLQLENPAA